jgi:DNA-binding transcriptional LysR family regulator
VPHEVKALLPGPHAQNPSPPRRCLITHTAMRLDRFDLNLLVALDVLLDECSVTRTAARLHIGQPATSAALARLREYFGDELLVLVGRRLVRTPLAESLVEPVRATLMQARATLARKPGFDAQSAQRRFLVCASDYAVTVLLAEVVRRARGLAPGVMLDIRNPAHDVFDVFERGAIDLLFMPEPYLAASPAPKARLFEDTHVAVVSADAPPEGAPLTMERYLDRRHVAVHYGNEDSNAFEERFLPRHGKQRHIDVTVASFSMVPLVLTGTDRMATLHRRQAEHFARHFPLRLLDLPFEMPPLVELMAWPAHLQDDPAHAWLRKLVQDCAAKLPAFDQGSDLRREA